LSLPELTRPDRKQLVGLLPDDPAMVLEEGAQVTAASAEGTGIGGNSIGHVTSSYHSPTLGRGFALALVEGGRALIGSQVHVPTTGGAILVAVVDPVFVDKAGERSRPRPVPRRGIEPLLAAVPQPALVARASSSVRLAVLAATTRLSVRAGSAASTAIGLALGVLLPTAPCRSVITRDRVALWLGPDEWLIVAPENASTLAARAAKAAGDHPVSVVDVSHRARTLEITGRHAAWCLNAFCALDLDVHAFPVGMCTRTLLGRAEVVLWRIAPEVFHLDVPRSFVQYVWACLEEARLEFADADVVSAS
ncbi:MAG TPA: glycine cleavage T C-terminal barrel domain-containing protein, partial [Rhodopila sp.]